MLGSLFSCSGNKAQENATVERDSTYTSLIQPEWSRNAVIYEVNWRQITNEGTIEALGDQLRDSKTSE